MIGVHKMAVFFSNMLYTFLIAFGVMIGASFFAALGALISDHPPFKTMLDVAASVKIWAVALALGGTFSSFEVIEKGILTGELKAVIKQLVYIVTALAGANVGYFFIKLMKECYKLWIP